VGRLHSSHWDRRLGRESVAVIQAFWKMDRGGPQSAAQWTGMPTLRARQAAIARDAGAADDNDGLGGDSGN
jgi:hypothetical protein